MLPWQGMMIARVSLRGDREGLLQVRAVANIVTFCQSKSRWQRFLHFFWEKSIAWQRVTCTISSTVFKTGWQNPTNEDSLQYSRC